MIIFNDGRYRITVSTKQAAPSGVYSTMNTLLKKIFGTADDDALIVENKKLRERLFAQSGYIRAKTNQILQLMGTLPVRPEELDDDMLLAIDPIGTVVESFALILEHEKVLNEELRVARDDIQAILSSVGVGILVIDNDMKIQMYNHKVIEQFSLNEQDIVGQSCCWVVCGMDTPPVNCTFTRIMETHRPFRQVDWVRAGRHFEVAGTPLKNRYGDVNRIVLAYTDITERVNAEQRQREQHRLNLDMFENAADIIQCVLPDGSFLFVNRAWREALGYSAEEVAGLKFWNIIALEQRAVCIKHFDDLIHGRGVGQVSTTFFSRDGREIPVTGQISCSQANGKTVASIGLFRLYEAPSPKPGTST